MGQKPSLDMVSTRDRSTTAESNSSYGHNNSILGSLTNKLKRFRARLSEISAKSLDAFSASDSEDTTRAVDIDSKTFKNNVFNDHGSQICTLGENTRKGNKKLSRDRKLQEDDSYYGGPHPMDVGEKRRDIVIVPFHYTISKTVKLSSAYLSRPTFKSARFDNKNSTLALNFKECEKLVTLLFAEENDAHFFSMRNEQKKIRQFNNIYKIERSSLSKIFSITSSNKDTTITTSQQPHHQENLMDEHISPSPMSPSLDVNSHETTVFSNNTGLGSDTIESFDENTTKEGIKEGSVDKDVEEGEEEEDDDDEREDEEEEEEEQTYDTFNVYDEVAKLRAKDPERFISGAGVWEKRRDLQYAKYPPSVKDYDSLVNFSVVPESAYYQVYDKLVVQDKPLKAPMNLKDLIKVINVGWIISKKYEEAAASK